MRTTACLHPNASVRVGTAPAIQKSDLQCRRLLHLAPGAACTRVACLAARAKGETNAEANAEARAPGIPRHHPGP